MTTWAQYAVYLSAGAFYYFMMAAFFSVAAGFTAGAVLLVLLALVLGGYAPGLSFFAPRLAAAIGGAVALLFLLLTVHLAFSEPREGLIYALAAIPAVVALGISAAALRSPRRAAWLQHRSPRWKAGVGVLVGIPALLATWVVVVFTSRLLLMHAGT